ncbi:MAG: EamA family transporter [Thermomicrobiales bacterium]|nr:EamA family transporter [Thermomicrobiales bacterium]
MLIGTGVLWGTIGVASKGVFDHSQLDAVSVTWLRTLMASPICILAVWFSGGKTLLRFPRKALLVMIALGIALILYQWLYLAALEQMGVSATTLISLCGAPVIVAVLSALLMNERLNRPQLVALAGALLGTGLLIGRPPEVEGGNGTLGVLFALGCAFGIAIHAMGSRRIAASVHPLVVLAVGFTVGAIAFAPIVLARGLTIDADPTGWILLIYLAVVPSSIAYLLYQRSLKDVPASMATIVTLLEPMVAAVLAWFFFDERLGWNGVLGGALLLASIWILSTRAVKRNPVELVVATEG